MKTDIDIKDDFYRFINNSVLHSKITGELYKTIREDNSHVEDIVISVNANVNSQIQSAYVYVNIYVPDILRGNTYIEDTKRLRELCSLSFELLQTGYIDDARFVLEEQRVISADSNEHVVSNKILYKRYNY